MLMPRVTSVGVGEGDQACILSAVHLYLFAAAAAADIGLSVGARRGVRTSARKSSNCPVERHVIS